MGPHFRERVVKERLGHNRKPSHINDNGELGITVGSITGENKSKKKKRKKKTQTVPLIAVTSREMAQKLLYTIC